MRIGIVSSDELTSKSLRASSYILNPKEIAKEAVHAWSQRHGGIVPLSSIAGKELVSIVEDGIRQGIKAGIRTGESR